MCCYYCCCYKSHFCYFVAGSCGFYIVLCFCCTPWGKFALAADIWLCAVLFLNCPFWHAFVLNLQAVDCLGEVCSLYHSEFHSPASFEQIMTQFFYNCLHQLCVAVPCRIPKFWAFLGIMLQVIGYNPNAVDNIQHCFFFISSFYSLDSPLSMK